MGRTTDLLNGFRARFEGGLRLVELAGLLVIGFATTVAIGAECLTMLTNRAVLLTDLLLMFLYLEVLAMVGQYFKAGQLPVRFPLYIAMVAMARELILGAKDHTEWHVLAIAVAILLLALGVLIIRIGQVKYPCSDDRDLKL